MGKVHESFIEKIYFQEICYFCRKIKDLFLFVNEFCILLQKMEIIGALNESLFKFFQKKSHERSPNSLKRLPQISEKANVHERGRLFAALISRNLFLRFLPANISII